MNLKAFRKILNLVSDARWLAIYDRRRMNTYELNSRNAITIAFAGTILAVLLASLSLKAISKPDFRSFVASRDNFHFLSTSEFKISGVMPKQIDCTTSCKNRVVPLIADNSHGISSPEELNDLAISRVVLPSSSKDRFWARLDMTVDPDVFKLVTDSQENIVIGLHQISYQFAQVTVNDEPWGTFASNIPIRLTLPASMALSKPLNIRVTYSIHDNGVTYLNRSDLVPPYISSVSESRRLENFRVANKDNNGAIVGLMSRILIGVFALMLFLFIDSAPESLGLALFLGFEAMALGLSQGWIASNLNPFFIHFGSQMGDVFRLYFFLQLARVVRPNPRAWLFYGVLLSIPWGIAKQMEVAWGIDGLAVIPRFRDFFAGTVGALACLRTLWSIRDLRLPWRRIALILGALGSIQQVLGPLTHYAPQLNQSEVFRGFFVVFEALSVYILALSTFTNISTLENRVKSLSAAKARSDLIEQELELGRTVQRAFLNIPKLPPDFDVIGSHEAAVYVSGDIYFVHWDEVEQRLVLVLSDVTGHGVQASLKATACFMIARNLWQSRPPIENGMGGTSVKSRLKSFHRQSSDLLSLFNEIPDIATFAGVEIFPRSRRAFFYRNNFHTPIILEPDDVGSWNVTIPVMKVAEIVDYRIKPGTIIALFSDGFVDGSRQMSQLKKFITSKLPHFDGHAASVKDIFNEFNEQNLKRPVDDRTLIVLTWKRDEYLTRTPQPAKEAS